MGISLNTYIAPQDCVVQPGEQVVELKACENCMATFTRPKAELKPVVVKNVHRVQYGWDGHFDDPEESTIFVDTGERFCRNCRSRMLLPEQDASYREQLPKEAEMRHANHLPRYDETLVKKLLTYKI